MIFLILLLIDFCQVYPREIEKQFKLNENNVVIFTEKEDFFNNLKLDDKFYQIIDNERYIKDINEMLNQKDTKVINLNVDEFGLFFIRYISESDWSIVINSKIFKYSKNPNVLIQNKVTVVKVMKDSIILNIFEISDRDKIKIKYYMENSIYKSQYALVNKNGRDHLAIRLFVRQKFNIKTFNIT